MTTTGYGISAIGNPLGLYGLGTGGSFSSYDSYMPSMMGMNYGMMGMNNPLFGMNGMMGMYNPSFMAQMQQQVEASQLIHAQNMQGQILNNEVTANRKSDSALIQKILTTADAQQGIQNLYNKVREGDQDGICEEFDKLRQSIIVRYGDELKAMGNETNPLTAATELIEVMYGQTISAQTGQVADLRSDIKKYGDGAFANGFMSGFRADHHGRYIDETLNHCFGIAVDQKGSKDKKQTVGNGIGHAASAVEKGLYGAAAGAGVGLGALGTVKGLNWLIGSKQFVDGNGNACAKTAKGAKCIGKGAAWIRNLKWGKFGGWGAALGLAAGIAADIWWQSSRA